MSLVNCMLSTKDNPFDPFERFNDWLMFDNEKGYNCCGKLARIAKFSDDLSDFEENVEIERAVDTIIKFDFTDNYIKVWPKGSEQSKEPKMYINSATENPENRED